jgi:hypothetical protein
MAADILYYGGAIPANFIETFYDVIKIWQDVNLDNQMARKLLAFRGLNETTEEYEVQKLDISGEEVVPSAKNQPGQKMTVGMGTDFDKIWRWPIGFELNEADLAKDPRLQAWHVEACTAKIYRAEDKAFFAGFAANNIAGFQAAARANPNGKIVASGASGNDVNNGGAWLVSDTSRDIYTDIRNARAKLKAKYRTTLQNIFLAGNADSLDALWDKDPYSDQSQRIFESVAPLFGRRPEDPVNSWAIVNDQIDDGYVYLVVKNPEVAELLEAKAIAIDDNYPRKAIGNLEVWIYEDVGISIKDSQGFVEIAVT